MKSKTDENEQEPIIELKKNVLIPTKDAEKTKIVKELLRYKGKAVIGTLAVATGLGDAVADHLIEMVQQGIVEVK